MFIGEDGIELVHVERLCAIYSSVVGRFGPGARGVDGQNRQAEQQQACGDEAIALTSTKGKPRKKQRALKEGNAMVSPLCSCA